MPVYFHVPPELLGFHHVGTEVYYRNDSAAAYGYHVCDGEGEDPDCSDKEFADSIHDHLHYFGEAIGDSGC